MKALQCGLLVTALSGTLTWAQPSDPLAAVHRAGKLAGAAAQANLLTVNAMTHFSRAVSALAAEVKTARPFVTSRPQKDVLAAYTVVQRRFERAVTNLELWAAMQDKTDEITTLMGAVPATLGGSEAKAHILGNLETQGQGAAAQAKFALATAATALAEGRDALTKADRAYWKLVAPPPLDPAKPPHE